ncbi:hypothetical protein NCS52_00612500 [Fusarium sp. LHS14.1]|nr:hypothetical protein NCS52_00612500 [Fusarium sp. LHS14.1]
MCPSIKIKLANALSESGYSTKDYVNSILGNINIPCPRLECPASDAKRYIPIRAPSIARSGIDYIFAVRVTSNLDQLPTLLGAVLNAMYYLGPYRCALTVIDGGWNQQIDDVLEELRLGVEHIGAVYNYTSFVYGPSVYRHRNQAIRAVRHARKEVSEDATIVFLDDVDICSEDILELILQRENLGADMTCGMQWAPNKSNGIPLLKNDGTCRDMQGNRLGRVAPKKWTEETDVKEYFWKSSKDQARFQEKRPFQVFSCWGGAAAFSASTFTRLEQMFRLPVEKAECSQPDTRLFCKDMWSHGRGKIAVIPSVNVARRQYDGFDVKKSIGYTSDLIRGQDPKEDRIAWVEEPPKEVVCSNHRWDAWDAGLPLDDPWDYELEEEVF